MVHIRVVYILLSLAASGPHTLCILTAVQMSAFCKFVCGFFFPCQSCNHESTELP